MIVGSFGPSFESNQNYVWYLPYIGTAKNALYSMHTDIYKKYKSSTREVTPLDTYNLPSEENNLLITDGCSPWAEKEIHKAAAQNLLIYDLTDNYTQNISRQDFCYLASRLIATVNSPESDSRMGI